MTEYKCVAHLGLKWVSCKWHFANDAQNNKKVWHNLTTLSSGAGLSFLYLVHPSPSLYSQDRQVGIKLELLPWERFASLCQSTHCRCDGHMRVISSVRILELQSTEIPFLTQTAEKWTEVVRFSGNWRKGKKMHHQRGRSSCSCGTVEEFGQC